jgi:hypothetical protein
LVFLIVSPGAAKYPFAALPVPRSVFFGPPRLSNIYATAIASPAVLNNLFTSAPGFGALNK